VNQLDSGTEGVSFRHCGSDGQLDSGAEVQLDFTVDNRAKGQLDSVAAAQ
jgi:hypothetical protein